MSGRPTLRERRKTICAPSSRKSGRDRRVSALPRAASQDRLVFSTANGTAPEGVNFVQENGPERVELRRDTIRSVGEAIRNDVIM